MSFASSRVSVGRVPGEHEGLACKRYRRRLSAAPVDFRPMHPGARAAGDHLAVMRLGKKLRIWIPPPPARRRAPAAIGFASRQPSVCPACRSAAPDPWPSPRRHCGCQRKNEARQRRRLAVLDGGKQVRRRLLGHAVQIASVARSQPVQIRRASGRGRRPPVARPACRRALDVHRAAAGEMQQRLLALRRAEQAAGAARDGLVLEPHDLRAAHRAAGSACTNACGSGAAASPSPRTPLRESRRRRAARSPCRRRARPCARISSSLCSVALVTVTPPTNTGASRATGVSAPVRPTWTSIASTVVVASSAGIFVRDRPARRARDEAQPLLQRQASSTLYTTPSMSNGSCRGCARCARRTRSGPPRRCTTSRCSQTGKPQLASASSTSAVRRRQLASPAISPSAVGEEATAAAAR